MTRPLKRRTSLPRRVLCIGDMTVDIFAQAMPLFLLLIKPRDTESGQAPLTH